MRPDGNPLDLNNFPDDYLQQVNEDTPSSAVIIQGGGGGGGYPKKKITSRKEYDKAAGKIYQCRFCSLKFGKSQALGGHMNRHRQERETETLDKARQLVFGTDGPPPPSQHLGSQHLGSQHLGLGTGQAVNITHGGGGLNYHQQMRSLSSSSYPTGPPRLFPSATTAGSSYPSNYHNQLDHFHQHATASQSYMGHVLPPQHANPNIYVGEGSTSYTCMGAPGGQSFSGPTPAAQNGPRQMD